MPDHALNRTRRHAASFLRASVALGRLACLPLGAIP
jgi:hypothetical protein